MTRQELETMIKAMVLSNPPQQEQRTDQLVKAIIQLVSDWSQTIDSLKP
jgi:hypothetical protein